jgi:MHS family proline/betaine transporter-like MFS transporter
VSEVTCASGKRNAQRDAHNLCVATFGGTTPYVVSWLTAQTANSVAPAYYVVAAAVSLLTVLTIRETTGRPLPRR